MYLKLVMLALTMAVSKRTSRFIIHLLIDYIVSNAQDVHENQTFRPPLSHEHIVAVSTLHQNTIHYFRSANHIHIARQHQTDSCMLISTSERLDCKPSGLKRQDYVVDKNKKRR